MGHVFEELVEKQRAADQAHHRVEDLRHSYGPPAEHKWSRKQATTYETAFRAWRDLDRDIRSAMAEYAKERGRARQEVETDVHAAVGHVEPE